MLNIDPLKGSDFGLELEESLISEEFTLNNLGITSRRLQHWSETGLLPDSKRVTDENHKFSFVGLIWLKLVIELREMGIPLSIIKKIKGHLLKKQSIPEMFGLANDLEIAQWMHKLWAEKIKNKAAFIKDFSSKDLYKKMEKKRTSLLYWLISHFLQKREMVNIAIFATGNVLPISPSNDPDEKIAELLAKETHIRVPLFKLIMNFINDKDNFTFISKAKLLNDSEIEILSLIRTGRYSSITVQFKNREPFLLEVTERTKVSKEAKLSELLLDRGYQRMEIVTQDGDITYAPRTTKHFLK